MQPVPAKERGKGTRCGGGGRLGNQIIRGLAVSLVAEKHNLKVDYCGGPHIGPSKDSISKLGIDLFSGTKTYSRTNKAIPFHNERVYYSVPNCKQAEKLLGFI